MDRSSEDVGLDNVDAADGENKVDLGDMYIGSGDTNDGIGVDNADSKFDCGDVRNGGDGDDEDNGSVDDDGDPDSIIVNDANCGGGRSKVDSCDQAPDLWQQLELVSELKSDLRDTVDWVRKWLVDLNAEKLN